MNEFIDPACQPDCGDIPRVAMDSMNDVHCEELEIVKGIQAAIAYSETDFSDVDRLMKKWMGHTRAHFSRENALMDTHLFPAYRCHREEHDKALHLLESTNKNWLRTRDRDELSSFIRDVWLSWFFDHIATMDVVTAAYISQRIRARE
ncbi:MAG: bacteriohemerythrin [Gammaproteobacteria bacterium]